MSFWESRFGNSRVQRLFKKQYPANTGQYIYVDIGTRVKRYHCYCHCDKLTESTNNTYISHKAP